MLERTKMITKASSNYHLIHFYCSFILLCTTFFQIIHTDGFFEVRVVPRCTSKLPCNRFIYFKICLRHYEKIVNYDAGCSFGEATISPDEYEKDHQIKFNFSWTRDFSLIVEGFNSQSSVPSERYAAKNRIFRHSFQEALEVDSDWKEEIIRFNTTQVTTQIRVLCDQNFFGKNCSQRCSPRNDKFGHFECTETGKKCLPGWQGTYCDLPICAKGCRNGTCKVPGTCECFDGYHGVLCDQCKVFPGCQHGSCKRPWECNCDDGWGGSFCDRDLNYCTNHRPCANGLCLNMGERSYTCECSAGYTGVNCDIPVKNCSKSPCKNGGSCSQLSPTSNFTCACPIGFTGSTCEQRVSSECDWKPCENGGTCSNGPSGYLCICPPGYTGPNCEIRVTSCNQQPCLNGATCQSISTSSYNCICRAGFNGTHCETNINDCASDVDLCFNGGTCIDGDNSYTCSCAAGFTGPSCQTNIDDCSSNPCSNGGQCTDLINGYSCKCAPGYSGIDCSRSLSSGPTPSPFSMPSTSSSLVMPNTCFPNVCLNGGRCEVIPLITSSPTSSSTTITNFATCKCRPGFSGQFCEKTSTSPSSSSIYQFPSIPILLRSEKSLPEETTTVPYQASLKVPSSSTIGKLNQDPAPLPISSFSSFEKIIHKSQTTLISVALCLFPFILVCMLTYKFNKRRIRAEERQRYENEEAIRQNEENSSKKCLQNDSCLIYNDLNRDSVRVLHGGHASLSLSHPHLHQSQISSSTIPQQAQQQHFNSSSSPSPSPSFSTSSCDKKLSSKDDYIVNEFTIDPSLTIYGLTLPPTLPPLTLTTDPSGISMTTPSLSCHPSPVYSKYATLTSHHHHPHHHQ